MEKWEYKEKTLVNRSMWDSDLNDLGAQGWELVSHSIISSDSSYTNTRHYYTFKRPVKEYVVIQDSGPK